MNDVNGDKGNNEIFTDTWMERISCQQQEKVWGILLILTKSDVEARERQLKRECRISRPFLDSCHWSFFLETFPSWSSFLGPVLIQAHNSCARISVLLPGVHFFYTISENYQKTQIWPCYSPTPSLLWSNSWTQNLSLLFHLISSSACLILYV